ncbi:MAG TPA: hypothetical protein VF618_16610 [Thermoanaerobaculia bacterium]
MFLAAVALSWIVTGIEPIRTMDYPVGFDSPRLSYARDSRYEYLGTPDGLWRSERLADPSAPLTRVNFPSQSVHDLLVRDERLYAGLGFGTEPHSFTLTFIRSDDGGDGTVPLDDKLRDCAGTSECRKMTVTDVEPNVGDRLFVVAAGNLLVTADEGETWHQLYGLPDDQGRPTAQLCPLKFELIGNTVYLGSECPLDIAWLHRGTLNDDMTEWLDEPQPLLTPDLENRNIQFIRHTGGGVVWVGTEGGLLRNTPFSDRFDWVLHYDLEHPERYPYIWDMVISKRHQGLVVVSGFDKKNAKPFVAWSTDGGTTWVDTMELRGDAVPLLTEDRDGRLLIVTRAGDRFALGELKVAPARGKRRAVK